VPVALFGVIFFTGTRGQRLPNLLGDFDLLLGRDLEPSVQRFAESSQGRWSGRRDSDPRPPAPKARDGTRARIVCGPIVPVAGAGWPAPKGAAIACGATVPGYHQRPSRPIGGASSSGRWAALVPFAPKGSPDRRDVGGLQPERGSVVRCRVCQPVRYHTYQRAPLIVIEFHVIPRRERPLDGGCHN